MPASVPTPSGLQHCCERQAPLLPLSIRTSLLKSRGPPDSQVKRNTVPKNRAAARPPGPSRLCRGASVAVRAGAANSSQGFNVVITGSTKGIGRAMAEVFLQAGDNVIISSRSEDRVKAAVRELSSASAGGKVKGVSCNVAKAGQVAGLANFAKQELGHVDLWINNAGSNAYKFEPLINNTEADLISIVETNVLGVMLCCREAINLMRTQSKGGLIYNMEGAGSDGRPTADFAAYGATKRSLRQLNGSLQAELKAAHINNVGVHVLSPGMVTTELLMTDIENRGRAKFFTNVLAEKAETSAQHLVSQLRAVLIEGRAKGGPSVGQGKDISFLTKYKAYSQLLARLVFGARKDRWVKEAEA